VQAYQANHGTMRGAVHFLITDGEKTLFYGLDGAWLLYDEVAAIQEAKPDFVVLDGTVGEEIGDYRVFEHNDLTMVRLLKAALAPHAKRFCITHMSRKLHKSHAELAADMAREGITVAFDGMEIEI
jgi:predicted metallo-beta-lactamase superfamily hydrolase